MPTGRLHDRITLWTLPYITGITFLLSRNGELTLLVSGGYLVGGLLLGPDLDIRSRPFKRWGPLRWLWLPYQQGLRHRSVWSHGPIVGTGIRLLYLGLWLGLAWGGAAAIVALSSGGAGWGDRAIALWLQGWQNLGRSIQHHPLAYTMAYVGLEVGAMSHSLSDWIGSTVKRCQRQGWRGLFPAAPKSRRSKPPRKPRTKTTPKRKTPGSRT
ncbi:MAG: metal-binding protein [Prochlorothrix sp.]|nr:metal-binding protein [Prochlorothrix sp.]